MLETRHFRIGLKVMKYELGRVLSLTDDRNVATVGRENPVSVVVTKYEFSLVILTQFLGKELADLLFPVLFRSRKIVTFSVVSRRRFQMLQSGCQSQ
jgi:hypothetical protein